MTKSTHQHKKVRSTNRQDRQLDVNRKEILSETSSEDDVETRRQTYHICMVLIDKLRAYAYWERLGLSEVFNLALEQFFVDKEIESTDSKDSS